MSCCRFLTLPTFTPLPSLSSYLVTRGPTTALTTLASTPRSARALVRRSLVPSASCSGTPLPKSRMLDGGGVYSPGSTGPLSSRRKPSELSGNTTSNSRVGASSSAGGDAAEALGDGGQAVAGAEKGGPEADAREQGESEREEECQGEHGAYRPADEVDPIVDGASEGTPGLGVGLAREEEPARHGRGERRGDAQEEQDGAVDGAARQAVQHEQDPPHHRERRERQAHVPEEVAGQVEPRLAEKGPAAAEERRREEEAEDEEGDPDSLPAYGLAQAFE